MAIEEIVIEGRADLDDFIAELNRAGLTLSQFKRHIEKTAKPFRKSFKFISDLNEQFIVNNKVAKTMQKEMLTASQINEQFTKSMQKQLDAMDVQPIGTFAQKLQEAGLSQRQWNRYAKENFLEIRKGVGVYDRMSGQIMDYGTAIKQATIKSRRFKFEWLGIMFAGMALNRVFGGLIRQQMQLFGVSDMLSAMWTMIFLPIMELISPVLFKLMEMMMNLSDPMKLLIGAGILIAAVFGTFLMVVGQIALGVGALAKLFGTSGLLGILKVVGKFIGGLGAPFLIFLAIATAVAIGIWLAWKTNFLNIRKNISAFIDGFKRWFRGLIGIIKGILNIIRGIFKGDFELVKKGIKQVFKGIWNWIAGGFKMLVNGIIIVFKGAAKIIWNVFKVIIDAILWAADKVSRFFGGRGVSVRMPKFQTGGLVTKTGPAFLHAGERVIPKNRVNREGIIFSPNVYIDANINNEMDIRTLADKLNRYWASDFERIIKRRGSI
ncbi:MAG: hypothetical protein ACTSR3_05660 [Candidatus Helarchaeota archaeon]